MGGKEVFLDLPPIVRSYALAGHYLNSFASMESALNDALGAALRLDTLQRVIICKNIQLRDKTKIVRTLIELAFIPPDKKKAYDKLILSIGTMSNDRNMVAHDLFGPDEDGGGIEFLVTKANGKLAFPDVKWTVDDTEAKSDELLLVAAELRELKKDLGNADIVKALMSRSKDDTTSAPIGRLFQLGASALGAQTTPWYLGSTPLEPTDAKSPETPLEPQE